MSSRDARQEQAINKYRNTAKVTGVLAGTFNHCTGFGKTKEAIDIVNRLKAKNGNDIVYYVIVPTSDLFGQWGKKLDNDNHVILTIQGIIHNLEQYRTNKIKTFFLIIDEIHKFAADEFSKIFEIVEDIETTHILGLTATWKRLDGKEKLLEKYCPIIDIITLEEARANGWVADFIEYCYGVEFNDSDQHAYDKLNEQVSKYLAHFNNNYDLVIGCSSRKDKWIKSKFYEGAESYINNNPELSLFTQSNGSVVEALTIESKIKAIIEKANVCRQLVMQRNEFINTATAKLDAVLEAVEFLNMKTITFGGNFTEPCDILTEKLGHKARSYHSKVESQVMCVPNKAGHLRNRKVGAKSVLKYYLQDFEDDKYSVLNTAKKADLGLDIKGLRCAIIYGRTSDPGTHDQRKGRVTRYEFITENGELVIKEAIILNIYIKGTKDENNLKYMLRNAYRTKWIKSLHEIQI